MEPTTALEIPQSPKVCFIDDSATMREVMKIAFRRENIEVVVFQDPNAALREIERVQPDLVITDVVMPEKDGFEVCEFIKQHPALHKTPVVLLSGVVDREVADKAVSVKADELVRKPFQPQDLIARVKQLLPKASVPAPLPPPPPARPEIRPKGEVLSGIFGAPPSSRRPPALSVVPPASLPPVHPAPAAVAAPAQRPPAPSADVTKLKLEVLRLENLVRKLQSELAAERDYTCALEAHVKTLHDSE